MAKDFKSFFGDSKVENKNQNSGNKGTTQKETAGGNNNWNEEINKFQGKSESELMQELFTIAHKNKSEGTLHNSELDAFAEQISPFLTSEQSARLNMLINQLKN
ncbi:MAG: hypothetical protein EOM87_08170 [Clostridia bacterium]|nr:hypothetical protein [Clostridia bacterium]